MEWEESPFFGGYGSVRDWFCEGWKKDEGGYLLLR